MSSLRTHLQISSDSSLQRKMMTALVLSCRMGTPSQIIDEVPLLPPLQRPSLTLSAAVRPAERDRSEDARTRAAARAPALRQLQPQGRRPERRAARPGRARVARTARLRGAPRGDRRVQAGVHLRQHARNRGQDGPVRRVGAPPRQVHRRRPELGGSTYRTAASKVCMGLTFFCSCSRRARSRTRRSSRGACAARTASARSAGST
jgi:hypothetical protein